MCLSKSLTPASHHLKTRAMKDMNHGQFLLHLLIKAFISSRSGFLVIHCRRERCLDHVFRRMTAAVKVIT